MPDGFGSPLHAAMAFCDTPYQIIFSRLSPQSHVQDGHLETVVPRGDWRKYASGEHELEWTCESALFPGERGESSEPACCRGRIPFIGNLGFSVMLPVSKPGYSSPKE